MAAMPLVNAPAVGFELGFAGASGSDAAAQPRHRRAVPAQPRQQIVQLRQFHLQLAFPGARAPGENIQDQLGPVQHLHLQRALQIALLRGRQIAVENDDAGLVKMNLALELLHLAGADQSGRIRACAALNLAFGDLGAGAQGQSLQLFEGLLSLQRAAAALQVEAHQ